MVAIFWDYENCNLSPTLSGYGVVNNIREVAHAFGSVKLFKAYLDWSKQSSLLDSSNIRSELQSSGVSLIDCPRNGKRDAADKMILVDMLTYAMDNSPATTLILISGDRDFAYAVSTLRLRQYHVVVVAPFGTHASLKAHASVFIDWNHDIVGNADVVPCRSTRGSAEPSYTSPSPMPVSAPSFSAPTQVPSLSLSPCHLKVNDQLPVRECVSGSSAEHFTSNKSEEHSVYEENPTKEPTAAEKSKQPVPLSQSTNTLLPGHRPLSATTPVAALLRGPLLHKEIIESLPKSSPDMDGNPDFFEVQYGIAPQISTNRTLWSQTDTGSYKSVTGTSIHSDPQKHVPNEYASLPVLSPPRPANSASNEVSSLTLKLSTFADLAGGGNHPGHAKKASLPCNFSFPVSPFMVSHNVSSTFPRPTNEKPETSTAITGRPSCAVNQRRQPFLDVGHNQIVSGPISGGVKLGVGLCNPVAENGTDLSLSRARETRTPTASSVEIISRTGQPRNQGSRSPKVLPESMIETPLDLSPASTPPASELTPLIPPLPPVVTPPTLEKFPPTESLPPEFAILVEHLKREHASGNSRAMRSKVATALQQDKMVYKRAGVTTFRQYTRLAEAANIVKMGGIEETAWISLHPNLQARQTASLPLPSSSNPKPATGLAPTNIHPSQFSLLVELLRKEHLRGNVHPSRSMISTALVQQDKSVYNRVGLTKFREYTALAEKMGIIQLGGKEEEAWICLHPDWQR